MELSKKYRWTLTGFIVMVIINIGLIASLWIIRPPVRPPVQLPPAPFWERELNLTPSQTSELRQLEREREDTLRSLMSDIRNKSDAYFTLLRQNDTTITPEELDSLAVLIQRRYLEFENRSLEYYRRMRQILDEEQRQRFNERIGPTESAIEGIRQMRREYIRPYFRRAMGRRQ